MGTIHVCPNLAACDNTLKLVFLAYERLAKTLKETIYYHFFEGATSNEELVEASN